MLRAVKDRISALFLPCRPLLDEDDHGVKSERGQGGDEHASGKVVQELLPASAR